MQRFQKILFVNDPAKTAAALQRALRLARANEAQLTVVSTREAFPAWLDDELEKPILQAKADEVQSLLGEMSPAGLEIQTRQLTGIPFLEIIKEVLRGGYDLVIKPAEGAGGVSGVLFGSTDLHLLRKCPCPVWIIKPTKRKKYARILAAVDPDPGEQANAALNALILDLATSLAQREGSKLHIVHAWSMPYESSLRSGRAHLPMSEVDRLVRETRRAHDKWLDELLGNYDLEGLSAKVHRVKGKPGKLIPELARKKRVELIVMGTVARTGIPGFFIGNTAEKTLAAVDCSVLAVKPAAFSTPVRI
jgi:nucleotide-binding universal stress UspA family protein